MSMHDAENEGDNDKEISYINVIVRRELEKLKIRAVSWDCIKKEIKRDGNMNALCDLVIKGFPDKRQDMLGWLKSYAI